MRGGWGRGEVPTRGLQKSIGFTTSWSLTEVPANPPVGGRRQCVLLSWLIGFWDPWGCGDQCRLRWMRTEHVQNYGFFSQTSSSLNTGNFFNLVKEIKLLCLLYSRTDSSSASGTRKGKCSFKENIVCHQWLSMLIENSP